MSCLKATPYRASILEERAEMNITNDKISGHTVSKDPKVTVLTPTYNRPGSLRETIESVVNQAMPDWEMIIINDGGEDVREVVEIFKDRRIRYFNRKKNRGKAACLNFALRKARGEYIAYIDDDDIWYPNHLKVLAGSLDENADIDVVYSDLYAVQFIKDEKRRKRYPLHKFIQACRDFNRDFMFWYNHTLHVSLMHRKGLAFKAGGYDEKIAVLIDWNITRKFCFFTEFKHIPILTGEYYMPVGKSDRISNLEREDDEKYKHNMRKIRADLPPEPWPKVDRIAVIFPVNKWADLVVEVITDLIDKLYYPVRYVIVNNDTEKDQSGCMHILGKIGRLKNVSVYTPPKRLSELEAYRYGVKKTSADYVYLVSTNVDPKLELRMIPAINYIRSKGYKAIKWKIEKEMKGSFDILTEKAYFLEKSDPQKEEMEAVVNIMPIHIPESLKCDYLLHQANKHHENGNYELAYQFVSEIESIEEGAAGDQFVIDLYSRICFDLKKYDAAEEKCRDLIERGYGADNWIRLGRIMQLEKRFDDAIGAYQKGFDEIGLKETDLESPVFPIAVPVEFGAFTALIGMAECLLELDKLTEAARMFRRAAKIKANSYRPFLGFGRLFLKTNEFKRAEQALVAAMKIDGKGPEVYRALGNLFEKQKKLDMAYNTYVEAFQKDKADPENIDHIYRVGTILGKWEDMKGIFKELLEFRPGNIPAMRRLSSIYCELAQYKKAGQLIEQAMVFDGGDIELRELYFKIQEANDWKT